MRDGMTSHVWIRNGAARGGAHIAIAPWADEAEVFAAAELAAYLERMSGARLPVRRGLRHREGPALVLLNASRPANRAFLEDLPVGDLKHDGFLIRSCGPDVFIVSHAPFGVVFGAYQYLARVLGCRFLGFGPDGEDIPRRDTIAHGALDLLKNPRLAQRGMQMTFSLRRVDWMAKNGFNVTTLGASHTLDWWDAVLKTMAPEFRKRGIRIEFGHHLFPLILPAALYLEEHPDYFTETDGKPAPRAQFWWSLTNPAVLDEVICRLDRFLGDHPEIEALDFWPADGSCSIDRAEYRAVTGREMPPDEWERVDAEMRDQVSALAPLFPFEPSDSRKAAVYAELVRRVATALGRRYPRLRVVMSSYASVKDPCGDVRLPGNVDVEVSMLARCYRHGLFDDDCPSVALFRGVLDSWRRTHPETPLIVSEYYMGMGAHANLPLPILTTIFRDWARLLAMGFAGAKVHTAWEHTNSPVVFNVNYLAFQAACWGDAGSAEEFLDGYCRAYFSDAWKPVCAMYTLWEQRAQHAEHLLAGCRRFHQWMDEATLDRSRELLDDAMRQSRTSQTIQRLGRLAALVEYARQALRASALLDARAQRLKAGVPTADLDREILPVLTGLVATVRDLRDSASGLFEWPDPQWLVPREDQPTGVVWEALLAQVRAASPASDGADPGRKTT